MRSLNHRSDGIDEAVEGELDFEIAEERIGELFEEGDERELEGEVLAENGGEGEVEDGEWGVVGCPFLAAYDVVLEVFNEELPILW